jgi:NADH:ubiquinone oxidoreductase subunit 5 (subunit L)/multisubunit Na+/H+ antiporter MnhA subunit
MADALTFLTLVMLPFAAALAIALLHTASRAVHSGIAAGASALGFLLLASFAGPVIGGDVSSASWAWVPSLGLDFTLMVDPLGLMFAGLILGIGLLVVIFGHFYLYAGEATGRFFASLMLFQGAMLGIVIAGNVLLLLVFWELTSLSSFLLIGFWRHKPEARQGARMALAVTGGGGLALIAGMMLLGLVAGSFDLSTILTRGDVVRAFLSGGTWPHPVGLLHKIGAVPVPFLASPRDGRADPGERLSPFGDNGKGRGVPACALVAGTGGNRTVYRDRQHGGPRDDGFRRSGGAVPA